MGIKVFCLNVLLIRLWEYSKLKNEINKFRFKHWEVSLNYSVAALLKEVLTDILLDFLFAKFNINTNFFAPCLKRVWRGVFHRLIMYLMAQCLSTTNIVGIKSIPLMQHLELFRIKLLIFHWSYKLMMIIYENSLWKLKTFLTAVKAQTCLLQIFH